MGTFNVWIGILVPESANRLTTALLSNGYGVAPLASDGHLVVTNSEGMGSSVLSMKLEKEVTATKKLTTEQKILRELEGFLSDLSIPYTMIVVTLPFTGCTWNAGVLKLDKQPTVQEGPYRTPGERPN